MKDEIIMCPECKQAEFFIEGIDDENLTVSVSNETEHNADCMLEKNFLDKEVVETSINEFTFYKNSIQPQLNFLIKLLDQKLDKQIIPEDKYNSFISTKKIGALSTEYLDIHKNENIIFFDLVKVVSVKSNNFSNYILIKAKKKLLFLSLTNKAFEKHEFKENTQYFMSCLGKITTEKKQGKTNYVLKVNHSKNIILNEKKFN